MSKILDQVLEKYSTEKYTPPLNTIEPEIKVPKGFYYDIQTSDISTRISLHPNTTITGYTKDVYDNSNTTSKVYETGDANIIPVWETLSGAKSYPLYSTKRFGKNGDTSTIIKWFHPEPEDDRMKMSKGIWTVPIKTNKGGETTVEEKYPYAIEPIASAVLNEDFKVSITNTFSKLGGDPLGQFINSAKSALPLMETAKAFLEKISEKTKKTSEEWKKEGRDTSKIDVLGQFLSKAANWAGMNSAIMNRAIVFQGARFSYYGGTGVAFDNVALNYTIFPYWDLEDRDETGFPKFKTVYDQLEILLPYVIGDFVPLTFAETVRDGSETKAVTFLKDATDDLKAVASSFGSWQLPPAGFEALGKDIDVVQKGTLKLKIGTNYSIENIIISSCNFSLSKHLIKHPQISAAVGDSKRDATQFLTPAFCDVQLALKPVSMASKNSLLRFMRGEGNVSDKVKVFDQHQANIRSLEENLVNAFGGKKQITENVIHADSEKITPEDANKMMTGEDNAAVNQYNEIQAWKDRYVPINSNLPGL